MTVSSWEVGTRLPLLPTIRHIADVFHVPVSSLISIEETGMEEDADKQLVDLIKSKPMVRELLDKSRYLSDDDFRTLLNVAEALVRSKV